MLPRLHVTIERWRKNIEYGVWVSTLGRIRLIKNKDFLTPRIDKSGYCVVFTDKGSQFVHRLVAYTWLGGKRNEKYNIDHIDSNKRNNYINNLRWIEIELNQEYAKYNTTSIDVDKIDCIEHTEDQLKLFNSAENEVVAGKILNNLFTAGKIKIYAGSTPVNDYNHLQKLLKLAQTPCRDLVFMNIAKAMKITTSYCGYIWTLKKV